MVDATRAAAAAAASKSGAPIVVASAIVAGVLKYRRKFCTAEQQSSLLLLFLSPHVRRMHAWMLGSINKPTTAAAVAQRRWRGADGVGGLVHTLRLLHSSMTHEEHVQQILYCC